MKRSIKPNVVLYYVSIFSIIVVFIGTLFSFQLGNIHIGSNVINSLGITIPPYFEIIVAVITLVFLALGNYSSKIDYPKLNKILRSIFSGMVLISIILILLNSLLNRLGVFK